MARRTAFLMAAYNPTREALDRTIRSLLAQTEPADIVIIDDGSMPPVGEMMPPREGITVLRLDRNRGITGALNHGIEYLAGGPYEFIARMDCGDLCTTDRIEKQQAYMDAHPDIDLVGALADIVDEDGRHLFFEGTSGRAALSRKLLDNAVFKHPTFFFRTSCFRAIGQYSAAYPYAEDYEIQRRMFAAGKIACLDDVLVIYEKTAGGLSSSHRRTQLWSRLRIQLRYFDFTRVAAYLGVLRTLVTLLMPSTMWTHVSRLYWNRTNKSRALIEGR